MTDYVRENIELGALAPGMRIAMIDGMPVGPVGGAQPGLLVEAVAPSGGSLGLEINDASDLYVVIVTVWGRGKMFDLGLPGDVEITIWREYTPSTETYERARTARLQDAVGGLQAAVTVTQQIDTVGPGATVIGATSYSYEDRWLDPDYVPPAGQTRMEALRASLHATAVAEAGDEPDEDDTYLDRRDEPWEGQP